MDCSHALSQEEVGLHGRKRIFRHLLVAMTLIAFALPLAATQVATPAHAQGPSPLAPGSIARGGGVCASPATDPNCYVDATPDLAFNLIGTTHTVLFTCGLATGTDQTGGYTPAGGPGTAGVSVVPGCYDVTASVLDETTGSAATFTFARCGHNSATLAGSTVNCAPYASPLCPPGFETTPTSAAY
jgi:hypothetical protein